MSDIIVEHNGNIRMIYCDELRGILQEGQSQIFRVSHVEPTKDGLWTADLLPISGPVLGPFETRQEALDAEVEWLNQNVLFNPLSNPTGDRHAECLAS